MVVSLMGKHMTAMRLLHQNKEEIADMINPNRVKPQQPPTKQKPLAFLPQRLQKKRELSQKKVLRDDGPGSGDEDGRPESKIDRAAVN